jgi:hypothetical protein
MRGFLSDEQDLTVSEACRATKAEQRKRPPYSQEILCTSLGLSGRRGSEGASGHSSLMGPSAPDALRARTEIAATPSSPLLPVTSSGGTEHTTDGGVHDARIAQSLQIRPVYQDSQMAAAFGLAFFASQAS